MEYLEQMSNWKRIILYIILFIIMCLYGFLFLLGFYLKDLIIEYSFSRERNYFSMVIYILNNISNNKKFYNNFKYLVSNIISR